MFSCEIGSEVNNSRSRRKKMGVIYTVGIIYVYKQQSAATET